jgi:hypothetical protein
MKKPASKKVKSRQTLAKKIFNQPDLIQKCNIAFGQTVNFSYFRGGPQIEADVFAFLNHAKFLAERIQGKNSSERDNKMNCATMSSLGLSILGRVVDSDHKFFSRLAAMIQFVRKPDNNKLYCDILGFCYYHNDVGTAKRPCDAKALTKYLKKRGHNFSGYENQVPRTLRAVCKKLGIVLTGQR